jgi:hypothetical protein
MSDQNERDRFGMTGADWDELLRLLQSEPPPTADVQAAIDRMFRPQHFSWGCGEGDSSCVLVGVSDARYQPKHISQSHRG